MTVKDCEDHCRASEQKQLQTKYGIQENGELNAHDQKVMILLLWELDAGASALTQSLDANHTMKY